MYSFIDKVRLIILSKQNARKQNCLSRLNTYLYVHCNELPLDNFIDCLVNNHYERLIKRPRFQSEKTLNYVWDCIYSEYCDLSGTANYKKLISLLREIGSLKSKLLLINTCLTILTVSYNSYCVNALRKLGYNYDFDRKNNNKLLNDLEQIVIRKKQLEITVKIKEDEYNKLIDDKKVDEIDVLYFDKQLINLSKWIGYRLDKQQITVSEYCAIIQEYSQNMKVSNGK